MNKFAVLAVCSLFMAAACAGAGRPPAGDDDDIDAAIQPDGPPGSADAGLPEVDCDDGLDNDDDGAIDCADNDCGGVGVCVPETVCDDGVDDEGDGTTDCADLDCNGMAGCQFGTETSCADGMDNDADGAIDCTDTSCAGVSGCEPGAELTCTDGMDNDSDGAIDCLDADCDGVGSCQFGAESACADAIDNDVDGTVDCLDPDCDGVGTCQFGVEASCADGVDNDADGPLDCADLDCDGVGACEYGVEASCADGLDNDADGASDCADASCDGIGPCEFGLETACADGLDNDADGASDCADPDCGAVAACVAGCPAGSLVTAYTAGGLPVAIPDNGVANGVVSVPAAGIVTGAAVRVSLTHTFDGDLTISLLSPGGATISLANRRGSLGDNYSGTVFSDAATTPISAGAAPFTGSFLPEAPLGALAGQATGGTWTLRVQDNAASDVGNLTEYVLYLCTCFGAAGCEASAAACNDGIDDDGDGLIDCADPDCAALPVCTPETSCADGVDNNGNGATDCADANCAATALCLAEVDCANGVDDDADGLTDCVDPGCASAVGCEAAEITCNDGVDNDADGAVDCADPTCAFACTLSACGAGERLLAYAAAGLPIVIADVATQSSTVTVAKSGTVSRVALRFSATHTYDGDLALTLVAPGGTTRDLSSGNGGASDNYTSTVFLDSAATAITAGAAPFTGQFRPEQPFSALTGGTITGTWTMQVADQAGGDTGSWSEYSLALCAAP